MTERRHRIRVTTRPNTAEVEAIAANKPGLIKRLAIGIAMRLLPVLGGSIVAAVVAFVALQRDVGATVAEVTNVRAVVAVNAAKIEALAARIGPLEADGAALDRIQNQVDTLVRESAEHGAILHLLQRRLESGTESRP